jgi:hypothetical protein
MPCALEPRAGLSRKAQGMGTGLGGLGRLKPAYRWTQQPGPRHPSGPAAVGSGSGRSKQRDADQSWMERVEVGCYCELNRDGPGTIKMWRYGRAVIACIEQML